MAASMTSQGPGNSDNRLPYAEVLTRLPEMKQKYDSLPLIFLPEDQQLSWRWKCYALQHRQINFYDRIHKCGTGSDKDSRSLQDLHNDRIEPLERLSSQCDMLDKVYPAHLYFTHGKNLDPMTFNRHLDNRASMNMTIGSSSVLKQLDIHRKRASCLESSRFEQQTKRLAKLIENPKIWLADCDAQEVPCTSNKVNCVNGSVESDTNRVHSIRSHIVVDVVPDCRIKEPVVDEASLSLVVCAAATKPDMMASRRNDNEQAKKRPSQEQLENVKQYYIEILPHIVQYGEQTQHNLHDRNIVLENNYWGTKKVSIGLKRYLFEVNKMRMYGHLFYHFEFHVRSITTHPDKGCVRLHWRLYHLNIVGAIKCFIKTRRVNKAHESDFTEGISTFYLNKHGQIIRHKVDRTAPLDQSAEYRLSKLTLALAEQFARRVAPSKANFNKFSDDASSKDETTLALV